MKKTSANRKAAKAAKPTTKPQPKVAKAAPAPVKVKKAESTTFRLPSDLKEALISHAFSAGYDGNMSLALCSILRNALQ